MASLYGIQLVRPSYLTPKSKPALVPASKSAAAKKAACTAYDLDTDVSYTGTLDSCLTDAPGGSTAFTCYEEGFSVSADMGCYFATAEQYIANWNTFHVAIASTINCVVGGCSTECVAAPDSVDAFLRHATQAHPDFSYDGCWPRLNDMIQQDMTIGPNLSLSHVSSLTSDDMKDPFFAARWGVARVQFQDVVTKECPTARQDRKAWWGGRHWSGWP